VKLAVVLALLVAPWLASAAYAQSQPPASSFIADPATNAWTTVGSPNTARFDHSALIAGDRLLIAGGQTQWSATPLSSTEIFVYDGNGAAHLVAGPTLNDARVEFTVVRLANEQVAMIGGWGLSKPSIEHYTPDDAIRRFTRDVQLQVPRSRQTILLECPTAASCASAGTVLILGGRPSNQFGAALDADLYDPLAHTSATIGTVRDEHAGFAAVQFADGRVVAAGGGQHSGATLSSIGIYDPTTEVFHAAGEMTVPRGSIAAVHLSDDSALFVGGIVDSSTFGPESLFDSTIEVDAASPSQALNLVQADVTFVDRSTATLTVQLEQDGTPVAAPAGGLAFAVASASVACASVPTSGVIAAGATSVSVTVAPGDTAPLPCSTTVSVSASNISGDLVNVTVTPSTATPPNPTGPGTTMVSYFNPPPVFGGPQRQAATFASVSFSSPVSGQQTPVVTSASTTAVSFFNPAPTALPSAPVVRNGLTMLSYFNPAPVFTAARRQLGIMASISFSNPAFGPQTPVVVTRASTTSLSFFNPAPIAQPTGRATVRSGVTTLSFFNPAPTSQSTGPASVRSSLTTLSFFNPAPIQQPTVAATVRSGLTTLSFFNPAPTLQPTVSATARNGLTTLSFFNPAPLATVQTVLPRAATASAVSFANRAATGGARTSAPRLGGTLDALRFAAGPTITEVSPAVLSRSAPAPIMVITGANLFEVTDVTFSDPMGITIGAFSVSPDGRTLSVPIVLSPTTPAATITVTVTGAMGSSPISNQTAVTIVP
jgi:hypothetical protein